MAQTMYYVQITTKRHTEKFCAKKVSTIRIKIKETLELLSMTFEESMLPADRTFRHHFKNLKEENKLEYEINGSTIQATKCKFYNDITPKQ